MYHVSRISKDRLEIIKSDILREVYDSGLNGITCASIAKSIARDEEFIMSLLGEIQKQDIIKLRKISTRTGKEFSKKKLWVMNDKFYDKYKELLNR